jgi:hypothetical protein
VGSTNSDTTALYGAPAENAWLCALQRLFGNWRNAIPGSHQELVVMLVNVVEYVPTVTVVVVLVLLVEAEVC